MIEIKLRTILNIIPLVGEKKEQIIQVEKGSNVRDLLYKIIDLYGKAIEEVIFDKSNNINPGIAIFLNGSHIFAIKGLDTLINHGDEILIFPPVGGG